MSRLLLNLLIMSISGSIVVGLVMLFRPLTVKIFPAKWHYGIGKIAIAFFLIPISFIVGEIPNELLKDIISSQPSGMFPTVITEVSQQKNFLDGVDFLANKQLAVTIEQRLSLEGLEYILLIWFVGAIVFSSWHFYCYHRFIHQFRKGNIYAAPNATSLLLSCKAKLGIKSKVKLLENRKIVSPMLVGLFQPTILLPKSNIQESDLRLIFTHELIHLRRRDLWVKAFVLLAGTLHWFNPLAYVLRMHIFTWSELSCDEVLASSMSHNERKLYGEVILKTLDKHFGIESAFSSSFSESKKQIQRRLMRILNIKKIKKHTSILAIAVILLIGGIATVFSAYAVDMYNPEDITYSYADDKNGYEKSYLEWRNKDVLKMVEEFENKVYVKQYSSFNELKGYLISEDDGSIFFDPEISDKKISFRRAYRVDKFSDVFEAIFVDYDEVED